MLFLLILGLGLGAGYLLTQAYEAAQLKADETLSTAEIAEEVGDGLAAEAGTDTAGGTADDGVTPLPPKQGQSIPLPPVQGDPIVPMSVIERRAMIAEVRDRAPAVKDGIGAWADELVRLKLKGSKAEVWDEIAQYLWTDEKHETLTGWAKSMSAYPNVRRVWEKLLTVHGYSEARHTYYYAIGSSGLTVAQDKVWALWPSFWSTKPL